MRRLGSGITGQDKALFRWLLAGGLLLMAAGFLLQPPQALLQGWGRIVLSPGLLLTDFMAVGGMGAAFFNSGLMMALGVLLCLGIGAPASGPVTAAVFSVAGFAFFGKTPLNAAAVVAGVLLYARRSNTPMKDVAAAALFSTAMGPIVSHSMLGMGLQLAVSIPLALLVGLVAGCVLLPVAQTTLAMHRGHNLYNTGLAAGLVTTLVVNLLRLFGADIGGVRVLSDGGDTTAALVMGGLYIALAAGGLAMGGSIKAYRKLLREPGRLTSDFVSAYGPGTVMLNIGLMGIAGLLVAIAAGAPLNGPVLGAMLMAVGFGAFGMHPLNTLPVLAGALLASAVGIYPLNGTGTLVVVMFSTTLSPIAGSLGVGAGAAAGFLHVAVANQLSGLQGGANLYNNGFAGGLVSTVLVAVLLHLGLKERPRP